MLDGERGKASVFFINEYELVYYRNSTRVHLFLKTTQVL